MTYTTSDDMKKICFITAIPGTAESFLKDHMKALQNEYKVFFVSNERDESKIVVPHDGYYYADIQRGISLIDDLKGLWQLRRIFAKEHFDAVHSVTPKAGLLTALAGAMARVPARFHIFTGQVWATKTGFARFFLKALDKLIARLDTNILVDGEGQRQYLIKNGVLKESNSCVLGSGSICGVNLSRFQPSLQARTQARAQNGIGEDKIVFAFMGRLNRDKGLYELLEAFDMLASRRDNLFLLLFGRDEDAIASHFCEYEHLRPGANFLYYGETPEPYLMLQAADVFVCPSYREGFGVSVIEASALGLPVICSDAYGMMDAMIDGENGLRCKVADVDSLYNAMAKLADNDELRSSLGKKGRQRIIEEFSSDRVTSLWQDFYRKELEG